MKISRLTIKDLKIGREETKKPSLKDKSSCRVLVAHACNPSYSGGSWFEASPGK
jgi:hypothetical protein